MSFMHLPPRHYHDVIFFEIDIRPKLNPKPDHHIYLYKKADMDKLEQEIDNIAHEFCAKHNSSDFSVDENWNHFKLKVQQAIDKHVPQKQVKPNRKLPWITTKLKRMIRKRERLFKKARRSINLLLIGSLINLTEIQLKNRYNRHMKVM